MNIGSVQGLLLLGALVFACAVLVPVLAGRRLAGSYTWPNAGAWPGVGAGPSAGGAPLGNAWGNANTAPQARDQDRNRGLPMAPRRSGPAPSSAVADWVIRDARIRRSVVLDSAPGPAYTGPFLCQCDGNRRYNLDRSAHSELWRCLHCGDLHSGHDIIPEEDD